jgi:hypothetical protein
VADKQKSLGKTVLSWFVVQEEKEPAPPDEAAPAAQTGDPTVDDLIARYASDPPAGQAAAKTGARAAAPTPGPTAGPGVPPPLPPDASVAPAQLDFAVVYKKRGLSPEEQTHVERALTLLRNLPRETPNEVKRQIVEASLIAFGFPVDRIIESALLHQRALDQHVLDGQRETQGLLEESTRRLQELEKEAARVRKIMEDQLQHQQAIAAACENEKRKVQEVLGFFGPEAAARVQAASPRLREPQHK